MLPNRPQDAFVFNHKTNQIDPINLMATDRVKCLNCNKYFLNTDIQAHLSTHTNQQLVQKTVLAPVVIPTDSKMLVRPLDLNKLTYSNTLRGSFRTESTFDIPNQPIDVQTMTADQLPLPEYRGKEIEVPSNHQPKLQTHQQFSDTQRFQPILSERLRAQPTNDFTSTNVPIDAMRETISVGDYFEPVSLEQPQSIAIVPEGVYMKRNINVATFLDKDDHVDQAKMPLDAEKQSRYRQNTYTISTYDPRKLQQNTSPNPATPRNQTIIEVKSDRKYLGVEPPSRINTVRKDSRFNNIDITPVSQRNVGGLDLSTITANNYRIPGRSQQSQSSRSGFLSFLCGDPDATLNNQQDLTDPTLAISRYHTEHNHLDGANYACPSCGGFYCPKCKSTVPPEYRRPPPYTFNQDIHLATQHKQEAKTNISFITPLKEKQI